MDSVRDPIIAQLQNASPEERSRLQPQFDAQMRAAHDSYLQQNPATAQLFAQQGRAVQQAGQQAMLQSGMQQGQMGQLGGMPQGMNQSDIAARLQQAAAQQGGMGGQPQQPAQSQMGRFGNMPHMFGAGKMGMRQPQTPQNTQNAPGQMNSPYRMLSMGRYGR